MFKPDLLRDFPHRPGDAQDAARVAVLPLLPRPAQADLTPPPNTGAPGYDGP